jgi:hypothetical protein
MCNFILRDQFMKRRKQKEISLRRENPKIIRFNTRELSAINQYCEKFKIRNQAKFMREAIISEILRRFDENYPTLWDDQQMTLF